MPALTPYQQLEQEFARLNAFRGAASVLRWDAAVLMPRHAADVRGDQLAAIEIESHAILVSPRVARLLERAQANAQTLDEWQVANLREMRRERERAIATPANLVSRLAHATAEAEVRWVAAREAKDFSVLAVHLEQVVALLRDKAALLGAALGLEPYDALVDEFSPGLRTADVETFCRSLTRRLPALIQRALDAQETAAPPPLAGRFPVSRQQQFAMDLLRALGFDFERGRLDTSKHPFTGGVPGDVRLTANFAAGDPLRGLLAVLHEAGHALYDQGLPVAWRSQPVGRDRGMSLQESQSLLLEMMVGRSLPFTTWLAPQLERVFGVTGESWTPSALHRRLNRVARSPIRVDADELTYVVHVMMRYGLERRLLSGELRVAELPQAWSEDLEARLGIRPADDNEGCLQDVHWAIGSFGYFPSYVVGVLIAGQIHEALRSALPGLDDDVAAGRFGELVSWLRAAIHEHGARLALGELIESATGRVLSSAPWLRYVESKYLGG